MSLLKIFYKQIKKNLGFNKKKYRKDIKTFKTWQNFPFYWTNWYKLCRQIYPNKLLLLFLSATRTRLDLVKGHPIESIIRSSLFFFGENIFLWTPYFAKTCLLVKSLFLVKTGPFVCFDLMYPLTFFMLWPLLCFDLLYFSIFHYSPFLFFYFSNILLFYLSCFLLFYFFTLLVLLLSTFFLFYFFNFQLFNFLIFLLFYLSTFLLFYFSTVLLFYFSTLILVYLNNF